MNKDISNLILYIVVLCFGLPLSVVIVLSVFYSSTMDFIFEVLHPKYGFIENLLFALGIFCFITSLFLPAAITKLALDKKWSKYLTCFFDNMAYPTIILFFYIFLVLLFKINDYPGFIAKAINWAVYSAYLTAVLKKFIYPLYKHFWFLYFVFATGLTLLFTMG